MPPAEAKQSGQLRRVHGHNYTGMYMEINYYEHIQELTPGEELQSSSSEGELWQAFSTASVPSAYLQLLLQIFCVCLAQPVSTTGQKRSTAQLSSLPHHPVLPAGLRSAALSNRGHYLCWECRLMTHNEMDSLCSAQPFMLALEKSEFGPNFS